MGVKKTPEQQKKEEVYAAIRSLYDMFPDSRSCRRLRTKETLLLEKKIKERKATLEKDTVVLGLEAKLKAVKTSVADICQQQRRKIAQIERTLNLRGPSEQLIKDIEKLSKEEPVILLDYDCE